MVTMDLSLPEPVRESSPALSDGWPRLRSLLWTTVAAVAWGALQWAVVRVVVHTVGWDRLPYNTVEDVLVWLFLAIDASAWLILCYCLYRFRTPILWFWWAACAAWWVVLFNPYHAAHVDFGTRLNASEEIGMKVVRRIDTYRKQSGRLPGKLHDIEARDAQPIPLSGFGNPFTYRIVALNQYELVVLAGDKSFCYDSRDRGAGFHLSYIPQ